MMMMMISLLSCPLLSLGSAFLTVVACGSQEQMDQNRD